MNEAVIGALATIIAALIALAGAGFALRQANNLRKEQSSADQRKLDQSAFDIFKAEYHAKIVSLENRLEQQIAETNQTKRLLRICFEYIQVLKNTMRQHSVAAPPTPPELMTIPWDIDIDE